MATCNLAQVGLIARLADEYFDGLVGVHALARPFVDSCLAKLVEVRNSVIAMVSPFSIHH
jgi:mediator of RNA polymerase II transcription subunit 12, fungi type